MSATNSPRPHGSGGPSNSASPFTAAQRDRQARNSHSDSDPDDSDSRSGYKLGGQAETVDQATREAQDHAMAHLDNPELLAAYAYSKGDSVPAARLYFMRMLCGLDTATDKETGKEASKSKGRAQPADKRQGGS